MGLQVPTCNMPPKYALPLTGKNVATMFWLEDMQYKGQVITMLSPLKRVLVAAINAFNFLTTAAVWLQRYSRDLKPSATQQAPAWTCIHYALPRRRSSYWSILWPEIKDEIAGWSVAKLSTDIGQNSIPMITQVMNPENAQQSESINRYWKHFPRFHPLSC